MQHNASTVAFPSAIGKKIVAVDAGVTVEEVSEGGSVPTLLVENKGEIRILFIEGEELVNWSVPSRIGF